MFGFFKRLDVHVVDADTIDSGGKRYRLMGFDAPETGLAKTQQEWDLGQFAANRLRELCAPPNKLKLKSSGKVDRFGRHLARLYVNGRDVAEIAVEEGWGVPFNGERRRRRPDWSAPRA